MTPGKIDTFSDQELLQTPINKLGLETLGLPKPHMIQKFLKTLEKRGINFKPLFWLSDEWYSPEGHSGVAIPFTLAHPRLMKLEKKFLGFCEGDTDEEFFKLLSHECGHAIDHAYKLQKNQERLSVFGDSKIEYPDFYEPRPYSKKYVKHLGASYAQSHPDEDFAETFAVWLQPKTQWKKRYEAWPALEKLKFMDQLMTDVKTQKQKVDSKRKTLPATQDTRTLAEYFQWKRKSMGVERERFYKNKLQGSFSTKSKTDDARKVLKRYETEICHSVAKRTNIKKYIVKSMLEQLEDEMKMKKLSLKYTAGQTVKEIENILTKNSRDFMKRKSYRIKM